MWPASPNIPPTLILLSAGGLVHRLHHGRLVKQDDPPPGMLGVSCIIKVPEVDIGNPLIRLVHDPHRDVSVLLVLPVQSVPHHVITGLHVE